MNIRRGLLRLWVFASAVWSLCFLGLAATSWYEVVATWGDLPASVEGIDGVQSQCVRPIRPQALALLQRNA